MSRRRGRSLDSVVSVMNDLTNGGLSGTDRNRFQAWISWAASRRQSVIPADPTQLALFIDSIARRSVTVHTIAGYVRAIDRAHENMRLAPPSADRSIQNLLDGYRRKLGVAPRQTAEALTADRFEQIRNTVSQPVGNETAAEAELRARATIAAIAVMRDAMLLAWEPPGLCWKDVKDLPDGAHDLRITTKRGTITRLLSAETVGYLHDAHGTGTDTNHLITSDAVRLHLHTQIRDAADRAGLGSGYSAWSPRIGMAIDLLKDGASVISVMAEGRWPTRESLPKPVKQFLLSRGGVARLYAGRLR